MNRNPNYYIYIRIRVIHCVVVEKNLEHGGLQDNVGSDPGNWPQTGARAPCNTGLMITEVVFVL